MKAACEMLRLDGSIWRDVRYYSLMGVGVPFILFIFVILFGSDSYQIWEDRFDYWLTNKYLFARATGDSVMGPLWRDDILSGHVWAGSLHTTPFAIDILAGRMFALDPVGIDLVGGLVLYVVSTAGMYLYLRQVVQISVESATLSSVMFSVTTYWMAFWHGSPDFPMAAAWMPLLLYMTHVVEVATRLHWTDLFVRVAGFSVLCFAFAANTSIATLPFVLVTLFIYIVFSFGLTVASLWNCLAASIGLILYSPFLWQFFHMATLSPRYKVTETAPQYIINSSSQVIVANLIDALREIMTNHNVVGLSLPAKLGLILFLVRQLSWKQEPPGIRRILAFALWIVVIGLFAQTGVIDNASLKKAIPVIGGFALGRFSYLTPIGLMILLGWLYHRCLSNRPLLVQKNRRYVLGLTAYVGVAALTLAHMTYVTGQLNHIPSSVTPQNYVLWGLFFVYAVSTVMLLGVFYRRIFQNDKACPAQLLFILMILTASLDASVHAYRRNISPLNTGVTTRPIMSYAERYQVSSELLRVKALGESYGRAITLEPFSPNGWSYQELAPLALAHIPTIAGYNTLLPSGYQRLVNAAINGRDRAPYLTELIVDDNPAFKSELLTLLDVGTILTKHDQKISGYDMVARLKPSGMVVHLIHDNKQLSRAFVSRSAKCFQNDDEALHYIRGTRSEQVRSYAPLIMTDESAGLICNGAEDFESKSHSESDRIKISQGPDRVTVDVTSEGGILTLADTFYPGWRVFVDGEVRPVLRTYTALRGVQVGAGHHTVEFIFKPGVYSFLQNLALGVGAVLVVTLSLSLLLKGVLRVRRRYQSPSVVCS